MKLRRIKAGVYRTRDGRFTIILDPTSTGNVDGWGYRSWLVFDEQDVGGGFVQGGEPVPLDGFTLHPTLAIARERLAAHIDAARAVPPALDGPAGAVHEHTQQDQG